MQDKLNSLKSILIEVKNLNYASAVLSWDQEVNMPPAGAAERGLQLATLNRLAHQHFTSDEVGRLLEDLAGANGSVDPDSDEARLVRVTRRRYDKATRVPPDFVVRQAKVVSAARQSWKRARDQSKFPIFRPDLEQVIDLNQEYASFFAPFDHAYDPLLDDYEPGMLTQEVRDIFAALRPVQVELVQAVTDRPQVDDSFLHQPFDRERQWQVGVEAISRFGYDWDRGRQDLSPHPFTTSFGLHDVRITTRVQDDFFNPAFFATLHECGHALYNQGLDPRLEGTPLAGGASLAIHESQSRMWENLVGRSRPFWEGFFPTVQKAFRGQLEDVTAAQFYKAVNKVQPSLIRVEADEATYNLHIMLRLDLEIELMEGALEVQDLPEAWNQKMDDYLGVQPPNDALGVLQDIHWSGGMLGYFSTYALGNLVSAQLWERLRGDLPDLDDQLRRRDFSGLLGWLREHVHRHGAKFEPQELVEQITGSRIDPQPYVAYLKAKLTDIYDL